MNRETTDEKLGGHLLGILEASRVLDPNWDYYDKGHNKCEESKAHYRIRTDGFGTTMYVRRRIPWVIRNWRLHRDQWAKVLFAPRPIEGKVGFVRPHNYRAAT